MTDPATDETELEEQEMRIATPVKTTFTPATPPETGHATRSATKKAGTSISPLGAELDEGVKVKKGRSPFDRWARQKPGTSAIVPTGKGKKRQGELMEKGDAESDGGVPVVGNSGNKKARG